MCFLWITIDDKPWHEYTSEVNTALHVDQAFMQNTFSASGKPKL